MVALYPAQDALVRGEISPRLHARASLDLYRAGLAICENFITLPHGGIRKRGGTYFVAEVKDSSKATRLIPFIFSSEQAYALEFGDLYIRVYAYGARVGTVEVASPYTQAQLDGLQFEQSADVMWITHPSHRLRSLTREAHTTWTLDEYALKDGPYLPVNITSTRLTPASRGAITSRAGSATATLGTAANAFDGNNNSDWGSSSANTGTVTYTLSSGTAVCDAYYIRAAGGRDPTSAPATWEFQGYDGSTWITLDTRQAENGWSRGEVRFYEFSNTAGYSAYRLVVQGSNFSGAAEMWLAEVGMAEAGDSMTPFNLTASSTAGINDGQGFLTSDVGRAVRLLGSDGNWRWARIAARSSSTVVTIRLYGHAFPNTSPITAWRLGALGEGEEADGVQLFEERLCLAQRFSVFTSKTGEFDNFQIGEEDDAGLEFRQAGGGQANDIVWLADADGFLIVATTGGIRALSGSGIDEALTPSSFKNRKSRVYGCARVAPVDAGSSFLYLTRSRMVIAELVQNASGRFQAEDVGQISEHIPKKGVVEMAFQTDPDPILWFPLDNGELGGYTHQPAQEVRGMHRHRIAGSFSGSSWGIVEAACVTPGQGAADDVWLVVKRTINGSTKRYIEIIQGAFEYSELNDAFEVDCGLTYSGSAVGTVSGLSHLEGQTVSVLADGKVYSGLTVSSGGVTLPGSATAAKWQVGLPFTPQAKTLELDVGGGDGSRIGRRKKVGRIILSVMETDTTGLQVKTAERGGWTSVKIPTVVASDGLANLYTGNIDIPVDGSWDSMGQIEIRHINPTPCTIRAIIPVFDGEP